MSIRFGGSVSKQGLVDACIESLYERLEYGRSQVWVLSTGCSEKPSVVCSAVMQLLVVRFFLTVNPLPSPESTNKENLESTPNLGWPAFNELPVEESLFIPRLTTP